MADTLASYTARLTRFERAIGDEAWGHDIGGEMKRIAARAAHSGPLGSDGQFSGWPGPLVTRYRIVGKGKVLLSPTRASAGKWTVATIGRNQGNANAFLGPGINRRTGVTSRTKAGNVRKVRTFGSRIRWNGRTSGWGLADDAVAEMERRLPRVADQRTGRMIRRIF